MTNDILQKLDEAEKAATRDWRVDWYRRTICRNHTYDHVKGAFDKPYLNICKIPMRTDGYPISHEEYVANAELIALARNNLAALIDIAMAAKAYVNSEHEHDSTYFELTEALAKLETK